MARDKEAETVKLLLARFGQSYAEEAGIKLADRPAPLYQLLVLATLLSARISARIAVAAARELFAAGYRTPAAMKAATWQDRVDALGRGHYRRYDERTSTMLGTGAELLIQRWQGDLRKLRDEASASGPGGAEADTSDQNAKKARAGQAGAQASRTAALLTEFPGIGPAGADIFLREVQATWPGIAPYFDQRARDGASALGLPEDPARLAGLVGSDGDLPVLAAALVRAARDKAARAEIASLA
jgi:endonuclease III